MSTNWQWHLDVYFSYTTISILTIYLLTYHSCTTKPTSIENKINHAY